MRFFSKINGIFQREVFINERLNAVEAFFTITRNLLPTVEVLQDVLNLVPHRDNLTITFINDSDDIMTFTNQHANDYDCSPLTDGLQPEDNIKVKVLINKVVDDGKFSIYDYKSFIADLSLRPLPKIMSWFSQHLSGQESLLFEVFDYDISFSTRTMAFESSDDVSFKPMINRTQRLNECRDTTSFYNMTMFEIIPDDFIIQGIVSANNQLQSLFGKIATILSLIYVSSSSSIDDDEMKIQICGQRTVNYALKLADVHEDDKWQSIYTWIYTDGNPTDKALIAHNVISLHCKFDAILNFNGVVFDAIKTNYNLYLRNNVDKYLEMKRDIAKFIQEVVAQVGDYAVAILSKFKANLLAIFGFLFTVVLTRIGSTQKWDDIFTKHTVYLIEIFIGGSFVYLIVCFFETRFKLNKTEKGYYALKDNYKDVLSDAELDEAFKNDILIRDTKKIAKTGMFGWASAWGLLLILSIFSIELFTVNHGLIVWLWNKIF